MASTLSLSRILTSIFLFTTISTSLVMTSSISRQSSSGKVFKEVKSLFVSDDPVVLEFNGDEDNWLIETQPDRILFLSFPDIESSEILKNSLTIYDGLGQADPQSILFPSVTDGIVNGSNKIPQHRFYSTGNTVKIRFQHRSESSLQTSSIKYQLKIQKAVDCPVNLGGQSSCGRAVDDLSCYCATFAGRTWAETRAYCQQNKMTFLRVDNYEEDLAIWQTWGSVDTYLWIGANDINGEGYFVWDNGGVPLSPGYTNWGPNEPNNIAVEEDCVHYGRFEFGWNDYICEYLYGGICEAQP